MTALAGFLARDSEGAMHDHCDAMLAAQAGYGRTGARCWSGGGMAMGRNLFPTLPEDRFDDGPVAEHGHVLVADVRLDNREELAEALGLAPGEVAALCDAGLLMRVLLRWGEAALDRLVGDYAFALWSQRERSLLLARDPLGQRPLFYHLGRDGFAFASMPSGLHALPHVERAPSMETLAAMLSMQPAAADGSMFAGIRRLPGGHIGRFEAGEMRVRRYWNPATAPLRLASDADYVDAMRGALDRAVAAQMRGAGAAVATHLSGGLDSSAVTATAARAMGRTGKVVAYTSVPHAGWDAGAAAGMVDEAPLAAAAAAIYSNIEHVRITGAGGSPLPGIVRAAEYAQLPILNPCNAMWYDAILADAGARGLPVLLTGQCGNLGFSYDGLPDLGDLLRAGRLGDVVRHARALWRGGTRATKIVKQLLPNRLARLAERRGARSGLDATTLLSPALVAAMTRRERAVAAERAADRRSPAGLRLWALQRFDLGAVNKGALAAWGVELRDPTTDRRLIELSLRIPAAQYVAGGVPRSLARRVLADRLPPALTDERRKGVQAADWYIGLPAARAALVDEVERIAAAPGAADLLDLPRMRAMVAEVPETLGDWRPPGALRYMWLRALSAGHFLRVASGG